MVSLKGNIAKAVSDPGLVATWLYAKLFPSRCIRRSISLCRRSGLRRPCFLLSFDCDTDIDTEVVGSLHESLSAAGIAPLYAVPGEILASSPNTFQNIASSGAVFLNHGFKRHARVDPNTGKIESTFFYNLISEKEWKRDISLGDQAVSDIIGRRPSGFRTPHFATFETRRELYQLWTYLHQLDYRYSSSTRPLFQLRYGPFFHREGIVEFPVSGCISQPEQIIDSWGLMQTNQSGSKRLVSELGSYLRLMRAGTPIFLNLYLDPSDISRDVEILDALRAFEPFAVSSFADIIEIV